MKAKSTSLFILIDILLFASALSAQGPTFEWATSMGSTVYDIAWDMTTDSDGNVYTTGLFWNTVDFDPGSGVANLTSAGFTDVFVQKLDANGNFLWAKRIGGNSYDKGIAISSDENGNVYVIGNYQNTVDFNPNAGTANSTSAGDYDIFIQKLDTNGNFLWARQMGGTMFDASYFITVDTDENVYATGFFSGAVDFDPGSGVVNLTSGGGRDAFVQKLDANGNFLWVKQIGGGADDLGRSVATDADGNVYCTGTFNGTVSFDTGAGVEDLTAIGSSDIFIQKLDANGNVVWLRQLVGEGYETGEITVDVDGNAYVTGAFNDEVDFDPGPGVVNLVSEGSADIFIQKLDTNGNLIWVKQMGGIGYDGGRFSSIDIYGNIYTLGLFREEVDFAEGTISLTAIGSSDIFIQKLDANGDFIWIRQIGGPDIDSPQSIKIVNGDIYIAGSFIGTTDFDPGIGVANLTSIGEQDIFIQKMSQCSSITTGTEVVTTCDPYTWIDGNTYTTSNNTATHLLINSVGCDSIVTLDLTINNSTATDIITTCDPYTWIDGNTYTASNNTATHLLVNSVGCDSIVTLDLTINNSTATDIITTCDPYTWIDGNTYTTSNNTATYILSNSAGCDSIITLDLLINTTTLGTDIITTCEPYTWIDGNTYTTSNNTATYLLTNSTGCDSIVTLDLTINEVSDISTSIENQTITANNSNGSYQWLDCNDNNNPLDGETNADFTASANGSYAVEITENNCVDTSECVLITTVGLLENEMITTPFVVYPNPTKGQFEIVFERTIATVEISILSITGQIIEQSIHYDTNEINLELKQPSGIYFMDINTSEGKQRLRIVKK